MKQNKKGITLTSLIVAIIIMLILTSVVVTNVYTGSDYKKYKTMCADIEALEGRLLIYYNKYGELPLVDEVTQDLPPDVDNTHDFYTINVSKLGEISLMYDDSDFIVDTTTFKVYFLPGIEYDGVNYYTY